jgi:hypothetical protein
MSQPMRFKEVEHKFLVDEDFDLKGFRERVLGLHPERTSQVEVDDTYYVPRHRPGVILRHRFDAELQDLTLKSRDGGDTESRTEVTLKLEHAAGDQQAGVRALLDALLGPDGVLWQGALHKSLHAFYFPDCEIVFYEARPARSGKQPEGQPEGQPAAQGNKQEVVRCVEFEARGARDLDEALRTLERYEERTGFSGRPRSKRSLFDLLLGPHMKAAEAAERRGTGQ